GGGHGLGLGPPLFRGGRYPRGLRYAGSEGDGRSADRPAAALRRDELTPHRTRSASDRNPGAFGHEPRPPADLPPGPAFGLRAGVRAAAGRPAPARDGAGRQLPRRRGTRQAPDGGGGPGHGPRGPG